MNTRTLIVTGITCLATVTGALAAFTPPTDAQIKDAANNPELVSTLLQGASAEQTSHALRAIIAQMVSLNLPADVLTTRLDHVVGKAMALIPPGQWGTFAQQLGGDLGNCLAVCNQPAVISTVQNTLITTGATSKNTTLGSTFGSAFEKAAASHLNPQNDKDKNTYQPPAPTEYPGQE